MDAGSEYGPSARSFVNVAEFEAPFSSNGHVYESISGDRMTDVEMNMISKAFLK